MSRLARSVSVTTAMLLVLCVVVGALMSATSQTPTREITLVARDMAFYLETDPHTPNPQLDVHSGERVRVVLRNQERGTTHDFAVPVLGVSSDLLNWNQRGEITLTVPDQPGTYEYVCRPHHLMMRGVLRVSSD
jgi:plastocyanin